MRTDLHIWQKRPTYMSKETWIWQMRPNDIAHENSPTYIEKQTNICVLNTADKASATLREDRGGK